MPRNLEKIGINPPKSKLVTNTTTRVELTNKLEWGESLVLIYKLSAKATAPLIAPLNHISISCFMLSPILNLEHIPKNRAGINTPIALAITHDNRSTITKTGLN
jgi:hypothetical protein